MLKDGDVMQSGFTKTKVLVIGIAMAVILAVIVVFIYIVVPHFSANSTNHSSIEVNSGDHTKNGGAAESSPPAVAAAAPAIVPASFLDDTGGISDINQPVTADEQRPGFGVWVVEISKGLEDFPLEEDAVPELSCIGRTLTACPRPDGCTDAQLDWLTKNANKAGIWVFGDDIHLSTTSIRNTATSGSALTVSDFKLNFVSEPISENSIYLRCEQYNDGSFGAATGPRVSRPAMFALGSSATALFGEISPFGVDNTQGIPAGQPATVNLEPGQDVLLEFSASIPKAMTINGSITAVASSGRESAVVAVSDEKYGTQIEAAIPGRRDVSWRIVAGSPCPTPVALAVGGKLRYSDYQDCTFERMLANHGLKY